MSFLEDAAFTSGEALTESVVDHAFAKADRLAGEHLEDDDLADAREGLATLRKHKGAIVGLTQGAAAGVLVSLAGGRHAEALELAGVGDLTFAERRALHHRSTDQALDAGDQRAERIASLKALAADVGRFVLTKLLPFLLAAL